MVVVAGVDEAGKGPVVGPMCVACVALEKTDLHSLETLGIKDSKKISKKKREALAVEIKEITSWHVLEVGAQMIDELRKVMTMNEIVLKAHAQVINRIMPDEVYVDAADVNAQRFGLNLKKLLASPAKITSEHNADVKYLIVSAASIVAKVTRDDLMMKLEEELGCTIGSGYPADPESRAFVAEALKRQDESMLRVIRHSWKTVDKIRDSIHL